ncbi:hypothetical protein K432DRAFT_336614 [Lepidopterella palustris CBS 459.81]|uniref:Nuclear pore complex protein n=1 Tax=Lepidopterella palustris CBS 459.81 TaxID=1314670 RepID=A0A8E2E227_9PEZI|nr:hypothetical protein K432DRAFT_336614 [Lepidopterella palustris CBS 459.81]
MAPLGRRSQSSGLKSLRNYQSVDTASHHPESPLLLASHTSEDALQPLKTMADRVGKEVEKFAERVDSWRYPYLNSGNDNDKAKYQRTLSLVRRFKDHADATVRALKKQSDADNRGELAKDVQRRIESLASTPRRSIEEADQTRNQTRDQSTIPPIVEPDSSKVQELRQWQSEAATWDLLRIIIELYHPEPGQDVEAARKKRLAEFNKTYRYTPEIEIWDRFIVEDDQAKEKLLILKWLEKAADSNESDIQSITEQLEADSGKGMSTWSSGWLDTKAKIKQEKRLGQWDHALGDDGPSIQSSDQTNLLVTELDPDSPSRQRKNLEKSDDYYERAIWMACYEMLRRGTPWKDICEWCKERNEGWRGVSMGTSYESQDHARTCLAGPDVGGLWRRMCFGLARGSRYRYECAVYGLLSGDLFSVEQVCRTWDDHLYARYNSLLLSRFDAYVQNEYPQRLPSTLTRKFAIFDAVSFHGDWGNSNRRVIELLQETKGIEAQSTSPIKLIQGSLISKTFPNLAYNIAIALSMVAYAQGFTSKLIVPAEEATERYYEAFAKDPHALRIVTHILLIFNETFGLEFAERQAVLVENIIVGYIDLLRMARKMDLIPLYAAQLSIKRRAHCLGRVLPDIRNVSEQKQFVKLMERYNIDVVDVISEYYLVIIAETSFADEEKHIRKYEMLEPAQGDLWPGQRIKEGFLDGTVTPIEQALIQSLHWYMHVDKQMTMTFVALTEALKTFLLNGRIGAALQLCQNLTVETISLSKTAKYFGKSFDFSQHDAEKNIQPHLLGDRFLGRSNEENTPEMQMYKAHTQLLRCKEESRTYQELQQLTIAISLLSQWREQEDILIETKEDGDNVDKKEIKGLFNKTVEVMEPLLHDFLTHGNDEDECSQLTKLRNAYLPEIILAYNSVIQAFSCFVSREFMTKSMDLATLVASEENTELADAFVQTGRMRELVVAFAETSKAMIALGQKDGKLRSKKKRGWKGETTKIWDVNVRN